MSKLMDIPIWQVRSRIRENLLSNTLKSQRNTCYIYDSKVRDIIKKFGDRKGRRVAKNLAVYFVICREIGGYAASSVMPSIDAAVVGRYNKSSKWSLKPFSNLDGSLIAHNPILYHIHMVHVSEEDETQIAFTPDERSMLADRQIRMRPGKYLTKYWGSGSSIPLLSDEEVKKAVEVFSVRNHPSPLLMVSNTDPDGWEWVYENSPRSCMRYNRSHRHLAYGLYGEYHPVRSYACPDNDLALAYILCIGEKEPADWNSRCNKGEFVVAARTIVNTSTLTWLSIYCGGDMDSQTRMEKALHEAGYQQDNRTLSYQKLLYREYEGRALCPYLDGEYTNVKLLSSGFLMVGYDGMDGQNSDGMLVGLKCPHCGDAVDSETDLTYVECRDDSICNECLENYIYAWVSLHRREWVDSDLTYEYNGEHYTDDGLDAHDLSECSHCREVNSNNYMVLVGCSYVCVSHTVKCEVSGDIVLEEDSTNTEFDGVISDDYRVRLYPSGWGHENRCYQLAINEEAINVHQETFTNLSESELRVLFVAIGDQLWPSYKSAGMGEPLRHGSTYSNVTAGDDCYDLETVLDSILEKKLEAA